MSSDHQDTLHDAYISVVLATRLLGRSQRQMLAVTTVRLTGVVTPGSVLTYSKMDELSWILD